jgi:hypothetical protein
MATFQSDLEFLELTDIELRSSAEVQLLWTFIVAAKRYQPHLKDFHPCDQGRHAWVL